MKPTLLTAAALATALTLTACEATPEPPPGRVVDRSRGCVGKGLSQCWYRITTKTPAGVTTKGAVDRTTYRRCEPGETYPACRN